MFRESYLGGTRSRVLSEGVLRHLDGSIDFDAYRERAHRARREAIKSSLTAMVSLIAGVFAKPAPSARHQAT